MLRNPRFKPRKTDKGWLVNIPASISDTGRFRRRYFKTKAKAKVEADRLDDIHKTGRDKVPAIPKPPQRTGDRRAFGLRGLKWGGHAG